MNLLGALAKVGSLTMVSRILGFVRDTIIARTFGAGTATDAFFVAFKLPNLLRRILQRAHLPKPSYRFWRNTKKPAHPKPRRRLCVMWPACCRLCWSSLPRWAYLLRRG